MAKIESQSSKFLFQQKNTTEYTEAFISKSLKLLASFEALKRKQVKQQIFQLEKLDSIISRLWSLELSYYEENSSACASSSSSSDVSLSKEWFINLFPALSIRDMAFNDVALDDHFRDLFPYHTDLHPLSGCLNSPPREPINPFENIIENQSPCSSSSIQITLFPSWRKDEIKNMRELMSPQEDEEDEITLEDLSFSFLTIWDSCLRKREKIQVLPKALCSNDQALQIILLLRILRYSISDIQIDLRLGRAVLLLFADNNYLDFNVPIEKDTSNLEGTSILLLLLTVMKNDYVKNCSGSCRMVDRNNQTSHSCVDFFKFMETLSTVIACGITTLTTEHATALSAFVLHEYDMISDAVALMDDTFFDSTFTSHNEDDGEFSLSNTSKDSSSSKTQSKFALRKRKVKVQQKDILKQNLFFYQNTHSTHYQRETPLGGGNRTVSGGIAAPHQTNDEPFRTHMILNIIHGLGMHAQSDRRQLEHLRRLMKEKKIYFKENKEKSEGLETQPMNEKKQILLQYKLAMHSWINCLRALVDIAEHTVRRLPQNPRCTEIGGKLVNAFVGAYVEHWGQNVSNPTRYAHSITCASDPIYNLNRRWEDSGILTPDKDVQDVVRSLFLRDLVDLSVSKCGYGDWLVWCKLRVNPLDPLLFDHVRNYHDDINYERIGYYKDERGEHLSGSLLTARYDFSLLMLVRAWHAPWTPESHMSFSKFSRSAIKTLTLCCRHYHIPTEINILINSFISRKWWPNDRRRTCWCYECQLRELSNLIREKAASRERNKNTLPAKMEIKLKHNSIQDCPGCDIAMYCCDEHRKFLNQDGHRRVCGLAPFRIPGKEEENLCLEVAEYGIIPSAFFRKVEENPLNIKDVENVDLNEGFENRGENDDDSSCWESVDSNEEEPFSATEVIHKFFCEKTYKIQKKEAPAFANLFTYHES